MSATRKAERRDSYIRVRVAPSEKLQLKSNARALGVTPSDYVRSLISLPLVVVEKSIEDKGRFDDMGEHAMFVVYDKNTMRALAKQLRAWGYHYNQAVHALNKITAKRYMSADDTKVLVGKALSLLEDIDDYRGEIDRCIEAVAQAELVRLGR